MCHQDVSRLVMDGQRLMTQPVENAAAFALIHYVVKRIACAHGAGAFAECEHMQFMVAEHNLHTGLVLEREAQNLERLVASIDQVASE